MSDATAGRNDSGAAFDDERGDEVDDYTGSVPRPDLHDTTDDDPPDGSAGAPDQPSGFGDGDVADIDEDQLPSLSSPFVDVEALVAERDQLKDMAIRLQADFENYRRRTSTQHETDIERATGRLAESFLPVLDAAEAAFVQHPDEVGPLFTLMLTELQRHGLELMDLAGKPFDPEVADAVAHEADGSGEITVAEVLRTGYRWKGRTLRPAMVKTKD